MTTHSQRVHVLRRGFKPRTTHSQTARVKCIIIFVDVDGECFQHSLSRSAPVPGQVHLSSVSVVTDPPAKTKCADEEHVCLWSRRSA